MTHDTIAVVDFGGQYAHLIATKVRRIGVRADILQPEDPLEAFTACRGIILSGSPSLSSRGEDSDYTREIFDLDVPILGFCFGHQEIAKRYGGRVVHGGREWGPAELKLTRPDHPLFRGLTSPQRVWMSHYDSVTDVGPAFDELGFTEGGAGGTPHRFAAIGSDSLRRYGFQFHPEVDDTEHGEEMIANFVLGICGCRRTWSMDAFVDEAVEDIRVRVGDESVFLLASGGVDSTVAAVLLRRALGPGRVHLLHIDNGLMRLEESREVLSMFRTLGLGDHLHFRDASDVFLAALEGVTDPETKRRRIGDAFIRVFQEEAERLGISSHLLAQGTIYPDTIETGGTRRADTIKTHHNRVPVIEEMIAAGRVVEPLASLYKVEVRELGERLGVPHEALWRHPFPGPGLGVRLLCSDGAPDDEGLEDVRAPLREIASRFGLHALPLPMRSVGVKADLRAYEHPVLLTGAAAWEDVLEAARRITAEVEGINRCVWNLDDAAPSTARPRKGFVTRDRLDTLRQADAVVMTALREGGMYERVWQCPTVLVPLDLGGGGEMVVVRPVRSRRAMTATPAELPPEVRRRIRHGILQIDGVSAVALDVTTKPPGTIEWE